ncbi:hypothetical protein [Flagellimonas flava]|uniref:Protochlamydia outer membrane protein domain-containing protein n=1 Tax=Flagellimonas flava TaxID=570519 RepID=A0A1M5NM52_9FLAO|nr:hypothetical protein [Allomuricauda flava]SHG90578.1 hypothetical protein SAMN04488116_2874 [Allomuricauda flava]
MEKVSQLRSLLVFWLVTFSASSLLGQTNRLEVQLAPVVSLENFSWSIAGNLEGADPNILSELEWENLVNAGFLIGLRYKISSQFRIVLSQVVMTTLSGNVTDTDYEGDNRQNPVFRTSENANKGHFVQSDVGMTYDFQLGRNLYMIPYLGVVYSNRYLSIINKSNGLDSSYRPYTYGPTLGVTLKMGFKNHWEVAFESRLGATKYRASGDWNLIEELQHPDSFRHKANMYSINSQFSVIKSIGKSSLAVILFYDYASSDEGVDTLFFEDGSVAYTQFNGASSQTFGLGLSYSRWFW